MGRHKGSGAVRPQPPTLPEVAALFRRFGGIDIVARLQLCRTGEEKAEAFEAARAEAKIYHRRLALEHHPDRGGDVEKLKIINAAWTRLQNIELRPHPPQPVRKSALNVGEARGPQHTAVFVGVAHSTDATGSATEMNSEWSTLQALQGAMSQADYLRMMRVIMGG